MAAEAWAALGGGPDLLRRLTVDSEERPFGGPLAVDDLAIATIASALLAAAELGAARGGAAPDASVDPRHAAVAFVSERHARVAGASPGAGFADLSRFARAADGWIRLHANYPHHRGALLSVLGELDPLGAMEGFRAVELEDAVVAAGGCAAAMRTPEEWAMHPQGAAVAGLPLLDLEAGEPGAPPLRELQPGALPAAGIRVVDLTRVIAGPVGTRTLAALGADVLRIDPPHLPELPSQWPDAGLGKRSALLDLRRAADHQRLDGLLAEADVFVHGYRPGALEALGIDAARHPHLVTVTLGAWGHAGPWAHRRGFDSLVQSACGIAVETGKDGAPGVLPAQALDHGTGYLIAAAALRGLTLRATEGRPGHARVALARTARWLLDAPRTDAPPVEVDPAPYLSRLGDLTVVAPPGRLDGRPLRWPSPTRPYGRDEPRF